MPQPSRPLKIGLKSFPCAIVSATCSTCLFQPFDLVKTRMQTAANMKRLSPCTCFTTAAPDSAAKVVVYVIRNESFAGLWKGIVPSLYKMPGIAIHLATIHTMASAIGKHHSELSGYQSFTIGAASRSFVGVLFLPFTVIKTRYESGMFKYRSVMEAVSSIWKSDGNRGLYSGLTATLLRDVPFSGLYLLFYTQGKKAVNSLLEDPQSHSELTKLPCGIAAGMMASFITQPTDVVKTKLQTKALTGNASTTTQVFIDIIKVEGVKGLFHGMMPRMLRRTFMAAFTWAFYEQIEKMVVKSTVF
ncbi:mitochondrial glycine transporter B-like [Dysidea avara]|uniref:mitochondrial glycine transporter B-like n=1 Tax=Dysidea avara TaxID=196820 RepID=UPI00331D4833